MSAIRFLFVSIVIMIPRSYTMGLAFTGSAMERLHIGAGKQGQNALCGTILKMNTLPFNGLFPIQTQLLFTPCVLSITVRTEPGVNPEVRGATRMSMAAECLHPHGACMGSV